MNKKSASSNCSAARTLFESIIQDFYDSTILAYMDSSVLDNHKSPATSEAVPDIHLLVFNLRSSGTRVKLFWIPSHTRIEGNESADRLACQEIEFPSISVINNPLSPSELCSLASSKWSNDVLNSQIKNSATNPAFKSRTLSAQPVGFSSLSDSTDLSPPPQDGTSQP